MTARRGRGDGGLSQRHDAKTCPPADPKTKERPAHKCQGRWAGTVPLELGSTRRKYVYGRTREEARRKLKRALDDRDAGTLSATSLTVEEWLTHWLDNISEVRPQTHRGYASKIKTHLVPHLGKRRLDALQPDHIRLMYRSMREKGLAEATLRQTHAVLARALKVAMQEGKISRNPIASVKPPSTKTAKRDRLTVRQAGLLLEATDDARWWLAVFYGMRQGEVLGLRWCDVDFTRGTIEISQTLQKSIHGQDFFGPPKSDAGARVIPLIPVMAARLKLAHVTANSPSPDSGLLVFGRPDDPVRPRSPTMDWRQWRDLLEEVSERTGEPLPAVALHSARNSAASLLEAAGVPARLAAQILGHSNTKQTESYQHADVAQMVHALQAGATLLSLTELAPAEPEDGVVDVEIVED